MSSTVPIVISGAFTVVGTLGGIWLTNSANRRSARDSIDASAQEAQRAEQERERRRLAEQGRTDQKLFRTAANDYLAAANRYLTAARRGYQDHNLVAVSQLPELDLEMSDKLARLAMFVESSTSLDAVAHRDLCRRVVDRAANTNSWDGGSDVIEAEWPTELLGSFRAAADHLRTTEENPK